MTGKEIVESFAEGTLEADHVGRQGGLHRKAFREDVETGRWRIQTYELRTGALPGNDNWFPVAEFLAAVTDEAD